MSKLFKIGVKNNTVLMKPYLEERGIRLVEKCTTGSYCLVHGTEESIIKAKRDHPNIEYFKEETYPDF